MELERLRQSFLNDEELSSAIKSVILGDTRKKDQLIDKRMQSTDKQLHHNLQILHSRLNSLNDKFLENNHSLLSDDSQTMTNDGKSNQKNNKPNKNYIKNLKNNKRNNQNENNEIEKEDENESKISIENKKLMMEGIKKRLERMIKTTLPSLQFFTNESARLRGLHELMKTFSSPPKKKIQATKLRNEQLLSDMKLCRERLAIMNDITEAADVTDIETETLREMCLEEAFTLCVDDPSIPNDHFTTSFEKLPIIAFDDFSTINNNSDDDSNNKNNNDDNSENDNSDNENEEIDQGSEDIDNENLSIDEKKILQNAKNDLEKVQTYQTRIELMRRAIEKVGKDEELIPIDGGFYPKTKIIAKILELLNRQSNIFSNLMEKAKNI